MTFFSKNFHLKILALISAMLLWFFVVAVDNSIFLYPQDLEIQMLNLPSNLSLASDLKMAKVRVRTRPDILKNLTPNDFEVYVDLKDFDAGEHSVPILARINKENVTILKVEPAKMSIKLEALVEKEVKIRAVSSGSPKKDYELKELKLEQKTAKISGVKSEVDKIDSVKAELKLDGTQSASFKQEVRLEFDKNGENVTIMPEQVKVEAIIQAKVEEPETADGATQKVVVIKPKIQGNLSSSDLQNIDIQPLTAVIQGAPDILKDIQFVETEAVKADVLKNQKPINLEVIVPDKVTLVEPANQTVRVSLK
jgi:YbbR domain-containing protein